MGGEFRWALSDDWIPGGFVRSETDVADVAAGAELAAASPRSFGPATTTDLCWWAGWTATATVTWHRYRHRYLAPLQRDLVGTVAG